MTVNHVASAWDATAAAVGGAAAFAAITGTILMDAQSEDGQTGKVECSAAKSSAHDGSDEVSQDRGSGEIAASITTLHS
jgi:hypothetical protein